MNERLYREFTEEKHLDKNRARAALAEFIASFESEREKESWAREFLERGDYGHKIRHEIYRELIFPVLLRGFQTEDAWAIRQLARTMQNIYDVREFWQQIGYASEFNLLDRSYSLAPSDDTREELLEGFIRRFDYSQHEWPTGILFGNDGALPDQCQQILADVARARTLDEAQNYTNYLDDFEAKVRQYRQRLTERANT